MPSSIRPDRVFDLQLRIQKAATALDRLKTGALVAATGGGVVLGLVGGGVLWMPAAMAGSLLLFRSLGGWIQFQEWRRQRRLQHWDELKDRLVSLQHEQLPDDTKRALAAPLEAELTGRPMRGLLAAGPRKDREAT